VLISAMAMAAHMLFMRKGFLLVTACHKGTQLAPINEP